MMMPLAAADPVRVGVAGLVHGHVGWILGREAKGDVVMVGIAEADRELARKYSERFGFSMDLVYPTLAEMLERTQPEAVTAFNAISDHRAVVEECARRGVHVMVEKPLAFWMEDARAMRSAAERGGIHLLTNYETTWYGTVHEVRRRVDAGEIGEVRKIVVRSGHSGPMEIGVGPEFLGWLIDPAKNGGGALIDFGCYGADLAVWLMGGERPLAVAALSQQFKPQIYPQVDDETTILVEYPAAQVIIQASWNWPFSRKDMAVYGTAGYLKQDDRRRMRVRLAGEEAERPLEIDAPAAPYDDPFAYLAAVVRGEVEATGSLSSLDVNMVVVEILDAARESARTGRRVALRY
jgi:predicted dehydrogenase